MISFWMALKLKLMGPEAAKIVMDDFIKEAKAARMPIRISVHLQKQIEQDLHRMWSGWWQNISEDGESGYG